MENTIYKALQQAVEAHRAGKLHDAENLYRAILQVQPKHPDANHNLGVLAVSVNKPEAALPLFKTALESNPSQGQFWLSYIDALIKEKQFDNARKLLEQGKKAGLAGEKVDALELQLATSLLSHNPESPLPTINPTFTQKAKKVSSKKEKKKNSSTNQTNLNQAVINSQIKVNALLEYYQAGRYDLAENLAREITEKHPTHQFSWKVLGAVFKKTGRLQHSLIANQRAVEISPNDAEAHSNLGDTLKELGRLEDAEDSCKKAIAIKPEFAEAHFNLGNTLRELGKFEDAEASYKKAIAIKPEFAEAHFNLANLLKELGRLEDAFVTLNKSIKIKSTTEAKNLFVQLIDEKEILTWDQSIAELVISALIEPWCRPATVMPVACRLLKTDLKFLRTLNRLKDGICQDSVDENLLNLISKKEFDSYELLKAMLSSSAIPDAEIEIFFTYIRRHFLNVVASVMSDEYQTEEIDAIYCYLAQQCFINEYVYFQTIEEIKDSQQIRNQLTKALKDKQSVPAVWVIAVACYFPLYSVTGAELLIKQKWSDDVKDVLKQQIQEPLEELNLHSTIPMLTIVDNRISLKVQSQYEENPYPRWMRLPKVSYTKFLNSFIQSRFPLSPFRRLVDERNP